MPFAMWQPHRGLLPIKQPCIDLPRIPHQILVDQLSDHGVSHPRVLPGSPEHLARLVKGLETLRDHFCVTYPKGNSLTMKDAIDGIMTECLALLDPPNSIPDAKIRVNFFSVVRKVACQLMEVIEKQQELEKSKQNPTAEALQTMPNGYVADLPRWTQFLGMDAPGAIKLQLEERRGLSPARRAYQVLPQGAIGILRHWDYEGKAFLQSVDPSNELGMWDRRFEWGALGHHQLSVGLRRFDPLNFTPSPWRKFPRFKESIRKSLLNNWHAELEYLDRCAAEAVIDVDPKNGDMIGDETFGGSLRGNVLTYDRTRYQQLHDNHRSSEAWDGFDCVVVSRLIPDAVLQRAQQAEILKAQMQDPSYQKKMAVKKKRRGGIAPHP